MQESSDGTFFAMKSFSTELGYDDSDVESVVNYAEKIVGKSLREALGVEDLDDPRVKRGAFGSALETLYFKIPANSNAEADFTKIGVELKSTPMKLTKKGDYSAKERLVLSMIDYFSLPEEQWVESHLLAKISRMLLVAYLFEKDKNPVDYQVLLAKLWELSQDDIVQLRSDWELIQEKVRRGQAHTISSGDTMYLEACTKAANSTITRKQPFSDEPAKPRAWAFKRSYIDVILNGMLNAHEIERKQSEADMDLLGLVKKRFAPYMNRTLTSLAEGLGYSNTRLPKHIGSLIVKSILGVDKESEIAEFVKAGIVPKVIRLKRNGKPKESLSFPRFSYRDLVEQDFEQSEFSEQLAQKYLFVVFCEDESNLGEFRLADVLFWQMPDSDLVEARACYDLMRERVIDGRASESVKSTENRCCHVRPKARNKADTAVTPRGETVVKKSFWLNAGYVGDEISRVLNS